MVDSLITTVGLFWHADSVFWGSQKNPGSLLGRPAKKRKEAPTDFRDQIGIYVLYADYSIVYVGQTGSGGQKLLYRLRQHRSDDLAERWNRFSWFGVRRVLGGGTLSKEKSAFHPSLQTVLNHVEAVLIHAAEPTMNGQGGRLGSNVVRYLQVRDDRLGPTDHQMLAALYKNADKHAEESD
jgi:hypothetical protein